MSNGTKLAAVAMLISVLTGCASDPADDIYVKAAPTNNGTVINSIKAPRKSLHKTIGASPESQKTRRLINDSTSSAGLTGRILEFPDRVPVAGATVSIRPGGTNTSSQLVQTTLSDPEGYFHFWSLSSGKKIITTANVEGQSFWLAPGATVSALSPTLRDGETTHTVVDVFSGHTISGSIIDRETSEPLPGTRILVLVDEQVVTSSTSTADGSYSISRVPHRAQIQLDARLPQYTLAPPDMYARTNQARITLRPGKAVNITQDLAMLKSVLLSGQVINQSGQGIEGARLLWMNIGDLSQVTTVSKAGGFFELEVAPFQSGNLTATAEGYGFHNSLPVMKVSNQPGNDIIITMEPAAALRGRVLNLKGAPVAEAEVVELRRYMVSDNSFVPWEHPIESTDSSGFFAAGQLSSGSQLLKISASGYVTTRPIVKMLSGKTTNAEFRMEPALTVEGRVITSDGRPQQATISNSKGQDHWQQTDQNGNFKFLGLPPGSVELRFQAKGSYNDVTTRTMAGTKDLVVILDGRQYFTRSCRVIDKITRQPISEFQVANFGKVSTAGKPTGEFDCVLANDFTYVPMISAKGYRTREFAPVSYNDKPGEVLIFEVGIGATLTGRALNVSGLPIINSPVSARQVPQYGKAPVESSITDHEGRFLISNLPYGTIKIEVHQPDLEAPIVKTAEAIDGETSDIGDITPASSEAHR